MSNSDQWEGDVLERRQVANFLYRLIRSKIEARKRNGEEGALCIAVDGDWGVGKTFFVERWTSELTGMQHPVVRFDAWKNDLADDPLIGFISALNSTLKPWIAKLPVVETAKLALSEKAATVMRQAARAAVPLALSTVSTIGTRYLGQEGLDLAKEVFNSDDPKEVLIDAAASLKISDKALQNFFDAALKQHEHKQAAIGKLVKEIEAFVQHMEKEPAISLPLFIFIDELDRCRPDYAIRLLEGMKHLFNARGVCFVVTTNLGQLSEAIKVVYGNNFDGYGYLKRFFDLEYQLPVSEDLAFTEFIVKGSTLVHMKIETGIHIRQDNYTSGPVSLAHCLYFVSKLFDLSLRSQKQVLLKAEAAALSLPENGTIHVFYLLCLTALAHKNPAAIDAINSGQPDFIRIHGSLPSISFKYFDNVRRMNNNPERDILLKDLFQSYFHWSIKKQQVLAREDVMVAGKYPEFLVASLLNEKTDEEGYLSLKMYSKIVRLAGQIFKQKSN